MLLAEMGMLLLLLLLMMMMMMMMMENPWMVMRAPRSNPFSALQKVGLNDQRLRCWSDS